MTTTYTGLHVRVDASVIVNQPDDHSSNLEIKLNLSSQNREAADVPFGSHKYLLPISTASDVKARDTDGSLTAYHRSGNIIVEFRPGQIFKKGEEYWFELTFKTPGVFLTDKDVLSGPFPIEVANSFLEIPVVNHKFHYSFTFMKPGQKWEMRFKKNTIGQVNSKRISGKSIDKNDRTIYDFSSFDLGANEPFRCFITRTYEYETWIFAVLAFVGGTFADNLLELILKLAATLTSNP